MKKLLIIILSVLLFLPAAFAEQQKTSVDIAFSIDWTFGCYKETTFSSISQSLLSPRFQVEATIHNKDFMHKITLDYFYAKPSSAMTKTAATYRNFDPITGESYYESFQSRLQFHRIRVGYDLLYGVKQMNKTTFYAGGNFSTNVYMQFENYPSITGILSLGPGAGMDYQINEKNKVSLFCALPLLGYGVRPSYAGCDARLMKYAEENFMKVLTLGNFLSLHNYQAIFLNADYNIQVNKNFALGVGGNFEYSRIAVPKEKPLYYLNGSFNTKATVTF